MQQPLLWLPVFEARQSPLKLSTAGTLSSAFTKTPVTSEVKTVIGEPATKPVTSLDQLPAALAAYATTDGNYYYADSAMSQPYYTTEALTDADVTGAASTNVVVRLTPRLPIPPARLL